MALDRPARQPVLALLAASAAGKGKEIAERQIEDEKVLTIRCGECTIIVVDCFDVFGLYAIDDRTKPEGGLL